MAGTFIGEPWKQPYTAQQLQDAATHQVPIIGANGNFWRWDIATSAYVDTGVLAGAGLPDGSVTTPKLADSAVTWPKLAPEARKSNDNLLDNAYFIGGGSQQGGGQFPINQRGLTEYLGEGYSIDRWKIGASGKVVLNSDCITVSRTGTQYNPPFYTMIENPSALSGKELTLSVLMKTTGIGTKRISVLFSGSSFNKEVPAASDDLFLASLTFTVPEAETQMIVRAVQLLVSDENNSADIYAAKLELGDHQTLAYESAGGVETKQYPQLHG